MSAEGELPLIRRTGKSEAAFRTISEVAEDLDVPQHVLRFWESKFPQVKPLKRGGGRRYYRPEDVALLRRIRDLLYSEGYTIKGVQKLLREGALREPASPAPVPAPAPEGVRLGPLERAGGEGTIFPETDEDDDFPPEPPRTAPVPPVVMPAERAEAPPPRGLPQPVRLELQKILDELESLRTLLHSHER